MKNIALTLTSVGIVTLIINALGLPLLLGYILGGALVGPNVGLHIVESHADITQLSSLGLIFLLFMIGLELDLKALLKMGRVVLVTGALQYPICAGIMIVIFSSLEAMGLSFGTEPYAAMYCGMVAGISSTMIVVKLLGEKGEMESEPGRLTVGILIFQDIWAIIVLAIQPNLADPQILGILQTFGMIAVLIAIALLYAKFVMPPVLLTASKSVELMMVLSLAWCFFICCTAILPWVNLSMELASLIAGAALATFPYSAEFNGKIKYIRDFFITLFFASLGMQIPVPTPSAVAMGALVAAIVMVIRWIGIFAIVMMLGGGTRLATIATINLSQVSEFALVICSLGMSQSPPHIEETTLTIMIWTFAMLAVLSSYLIGFNSAIYMSFVRCSNKLRGKANTDDDHGGHDAHHDERDIVLLGFHKVAWMLVEEFKQKTPELLHKIVVVDFNQDAKKELEDIGIKYAYGDISSPDVLEHAHHGKARIVLCTIPDSLLRGVTNAGLIKVSKMVWPEAHVICTADNPFQANTLYGVGADYVLRMSKLCAERLHNLLSEHNLHASGSGELAHLFKFYKARDGALPSTISSVARRIDRIMGD